MSNSRGGAVYILRGLPGCGKSTWAEAEKLRLKESDGVECVICSADRFYETPDGYVFDPAKIGEAHATCMRMFAFHLALRTDVVIVDNTNIHLWEALHYVQVAELAGYSTHVVEWIPETVAQVRACASRNSHGVPASVVANMAIEWEPWCRGSERMEMIGVGDE